MEKSVVNSFQNNPTQKSFALTGICFNAKKFNLNQENYIFFIVLCLYCGRSLKKYLTLNVVVKRKYSVAKNERLL